MIEPDQCIFPQTCHLVLWISLPKGFTPKPLLSMSHTWNVFFHPKKANIRVSRIHFWFGGNIHLSILAGRGHFNNTNAFLNFSQHHLNFFVIKRGENNFSFPLNIQWANTNLKENWNSLCGTLNKWQFILQIL